MYYIIQFILDAHKTEVVFATTSTSGRKITISSHYTVLTIIQV